MLLIKSKYLFHYTMFLTLGTFSSCAVKPVTVTELKSVQIIEMNDQGMKAEVVVTMENPNRARIKVKEYNLQASISDRSLGNAKLENKISMPARSSREYTLVISTDANNILQLLPLLFSDNKLKLKMNGYMKIRYGFFPKKIFFEMEDDFVPNMIH